MASTKAHGALPGWTPVLAGAALMAGAVVMLLLVFMPAPVEHLPAHSLAVAAPPERLVSVGATPAKKSQQRHAGARVPNSARAVEHNPARNLGQDEDATWMATGQNIQIAIPGDAVFPPGVVPEGVNFIADLSIAADGSAERLHLRP